VCVCVCVCVRTFHPPLILSALIFLHRNPRDAIPVPFGAGRMVTFDRPVQLSEVVDAVKKGLNLEYVQLAYGGSKL